MGSAPVALTKWLTQIFVDCNRLNKGEINEVRIEWTLKRIKENQIDQGNSNKKHK